MEIQGSPPDKAIESTFQVPRGSRSVASWAAAGLSVCWQGLKCVCVVCVMVWTEPTCLNSGSYRYWTHISASTTQHNTWKSCPGKKNKRINTWDSLYENSNNPESWISSAEQDLRDSLLPLFSRNNDFLSLEYYELFWSPNETGSRLLFTSTFLCYVLC